MKNAKLTEYQGKPTITLSPDSKWPFSFGLAKAKMILENLDDIREFIALQEGPSPVAPSGDPWGNGR